MNILIAGVFGFIGTVLAISSRKALRFRHGSRLHRFARL